jgi:hypothetical protein
MMLAVQDGLQRTVSHGNLAMEKWDFHVYEPKIPSQRSWDFSRGNPKTGGDLL